MWSRGVATPTAVPGIDSYILRRVPWARWRVSQPTLWTPAMSVYVVHAREKLS